MAAQDGNGQTFRAESSPGFAALRTGTRLDGRYVIQSVIAAGGFGITYIAEHEALGTHYALKEHFPRQFAYRDGATLNVRPSDPDTFKWALDRFLQEGRSLARCKHPNVVGVANVFEENSTAYMVLDYEDGQSFASWLKALGRPPSQSELDAILAPLLDALAYVHGQDLLHRDIAPDNIMIRMDGKPCLIDFGAARQAIAERSQLMSAIVKTGYSPPEQYTRSGRAQGPWSDIYALGATLFRAMTGEPPSEATERQIDDDLQPIAAILPKPEIYRAAFLDGIDAALRLKQRERPQSVAEWRGMLSGAIAPNRANADGQATPPHAGGAQKDLGGAAASVSRPAIFVPGSGPILQATFSSLASAAAVQLQSKRKFWPAAIAAAVVVLPVIVLMAGKSPAPPPAIDAVANRTMVDVRAQNDAADMGAKRAAAARAKADEGEHARIAAEKDRQDRADRQRLAALEQRLEEERAARIQAERAAAVASERATRAAPDAAASSVSPRAAEAEARAKVEETERARSAEESNRRSREEREQRAALEQRLKEEQAARIEAEKAAAVASDRAARAARSAAAASSVPVPAREPAQRANPGGYRIRSDVSQGIHNMRSGPGQGHSLVVSIPANSTGVALDEGSCRNADDGASRAQWCRVSWGGRSGWASRSGITR